MICPRCDGGPPLEDSNLKGVEVQICRGCRGILMTRTDLGAVIAMVGRRATAQVDGHADGYFARLRDAPEFLGHETSLRCPNCRYNMYEVESHNIVVDFCLNCQSIWFDEGELQTTLAQARAHGAIELVPGDLGKNETARLIHYMLDTLTAGPEGNAGGKTK
jgi:Zn-finger nucleic acid-binding protein